MTYYKETLEEELMRNIKSQHVFCEEYTKLKRGSLCIKKIKNKEYIYLKYRKTGKVITEYIGPYSLERFETLEKELKKSKYCKSVLKELKDTETKLRKAIRVL